MINIVDTVSKELEPTINDEKKSIETKLFILWLCEISSSSFTKDDLIWLSEDWSLLLLAKKLGYIKIEEKCYNNVAKEIETAGFSWDLSHYIKSLEKIKNDSLKQLSKTLRKNLCRTLSSAFEDIMKESQKPTVIKKPESIRHIADSLRDNIETILDLNKILARAQIIKNKSALESLEPIMYGIIDRIKSLTWFKCLEINDNSISFVYKNPSKKPSFLKWKLTFRAKSEESIEKKILWNKSYKTFEDIADLIWFTITLDEKDYAEYFQYYIQDLEYKKLELEIQSEEMQNNQESISEIEAKIEILKDKLENPGIRDDVLNFMKESAVNFLKNNIGNPSETSLVDNACIFEAKKFGYKIKWWFLKDKYISTDPLFCDTWKKEISGSIKNVSMTWYTYYIDTITNKYKKSAQKIVEFQINLIENLTWNVFEKWFNDHPIYRLKRSFFLDMNSDDYLNIEDIAIKLMNDDKIEIEPINMLNHILFGDNSSENGPLITPAIKDWINWIIFRPFDWFKNWYTNEAWHIFDKHGYIMVDLLWKDSILYSKLIEEFKSQISKIEKTQSWKKSEKDEVAA